METLKKPETIIGITNSVALIGTIVYVYRQFKSIREDLDELSGNFKSTVNTIPDLSGQKDLLEKIGRSIQQLDGALRNQVDQVQDVLGALETAYMDIETLNKSVDVLVEAVTKLGGEVKLPEPVRFSSTFPLGQQQPVNIRAAGNQNRRTAINTARKTIMPNRNRRPASSFRQQEEEEEEFPLRTNERSVRRVAYEDERPLRNTNRRMEDANVNDEDDIEDEIETVRKNRNSSATQKQ